MVASSAAPVGADSGEVPTYVRTIGGPLHAEVYPSGIEVAPDGTIVLADTGNDRIEKRSAAGAVLWSVGGLGEFSEPRDVGVASDGKIYVADAGSKRISVLSAAGQSLFTFNGGTASMGIPMGVTVSGSNVYVADAGQNAIWVFELDGTFVRRFVSSGNCSIGGVRDVDADASGNIYAAAYSANKVAKFTSDGTCLMTWGSSGTANGQFKAPYGVRIARDPVADRMRVYVADSNNARVQVFTLGGNFVASMGTGGEPEEVGTLTTLRRVAVAADGDVWAADLWGWRAVRYNRNSTGWTYAQTMGETMPAPTSSSVFHEVRGVSVLGGQVIAVDTVHHWFARFTSQGALQGVCGERGSSLGQFNWPRDASWDAATGDVWVADTKQYRIQIVDPTTCTGVAKFGTKGTGPDQFRWIYGLEIRASDGLAVILDNRNNRLTFYDVATRTQIGAPYGLTGGGVGRFRGPHGVSIDPTSGRVWVADTGNNRVVELAVNSSGAVTWVRAIGGFAAPEAVAVDEQGRVYVADTGNDRVVVLSKATGAVIGTFSGPSGFTRPGGIAVDGAGNIYVSDTYGDRIQVYQ
jgi:DNA-binding beta-propeller fold protein YncE